MRTPAFWDTSALVPLCVRQRTTAAVMALYAEHDIVVWWAAPVEIASALARLTRMRDITRDEYVTALNHAATLAELWSVVPPSDGLRRAAVQLVGRHDVRAADAFQLAAALQWCGDVPQKHVFVCADERLREAALLCGFDSRRL